MRTLPALKVAVLALFVAGAALAQASGGAERFHDWGRVHELQPGRLLVVRPFEGMGRKVVGTYVSSDATGIVVRLRNDQELELSKERVRSVTRRKRMRHAVLIGAGIGFAALGLPSVAEADFTQPAGILLFGGIGAGLGALGGLLARGIGRTMVVYRAPKRPRGQSGNPGAPDAGQVQAVGKVR